MSREVGDRFNYSLWTADPWQLEDFFSETVANSHRRARALMEII